MDRVVIIGAGECGIRAALTFREEGFTGTIDLIHGEPHTPYERPPLSKPCADGLSLKPIMGALDLGPNKITLHQDLAATAIDRTAQQVLISNSESLAYDRLLIAIGAKPRPFLWNGRHVPNLAYLRTYDDAVRIFERVTKSSRLTIIGGGFIGLELAVQARSKETHVTLIEAAPRLLGRAVPAEIATVIEARHRAEGVEVICGANIVDVDSKGSITLQDGRTIASDLVVAGIGSVPVTDIAAAAASSGVSTNNIVI